MNWTVSRWNRASVIAAIIIIGLVVTVGTAWNYHTSAFTLWRTSAVAEAERLTAELTYRVQREREPLISTAILYQGSEEVTQAELVEAHAAYSQTTNRDSPMSLAFVEVSQAEFIVRQGAGSFELLPEGANYQLPTQLREPVIQALQTAPQVVTGELFEFNGRSYLSMAVASSNAGTPGVLVCLIDFHAILQRLTTGLLDRGKTFQIRQPGNGDFDHAGLPPLNTPAEALHDMTVSMGDLGWQVTWLFDADANGVSDYRNNWLIILLGGLLTLLTAGVVGQLMYQRARVQREVEARTSELKTTFKGLQQAQEQLIQQEKMASLGSLVAGIAHELNTPIGNSLMAASIIDERLRQLIERTANGPISYDQQVEAQRTLAEASRLLHHNAQRAVDLINSFKQVAVDQTSDRQRNFNLRDVVDEVLMTLHPMIKRTPHKIVLLIPKEIELDSFPGPLGQVISNLVTNALRHAFIDNKVGHIEISAQQLDEGNIALHFKDDGIGMSEEVQQRIFEPFYTTKLGQGGSGLGMHISYNLVKTMLGGTISVTSRPGDGSEFIIKVPAKAPSRIVQAQQDRQSTAAFI